MVGMAHIPLVISNWTSYIYIEPQSTATGLQPYFVILKSSLVKTVFP